MSQADLVLAFTEVRLQPTNGQGFSHNRQLKWLKLRWVGLLFLVSGKKLFYIPNEWNSTSEVATS